MASFTMPLNPEGDDSAYPLLPEYEGKVEQPKMIDYGTSLHVQADLVEVVHGNMFQGKDLAMLIIVDFRFTSTDTSRRFRFAEIIYKFRDSDSNRSSESAPDCSRWRIFYESNGNEARIDTRSECYSRVRFWASKRFSRA